MSVVETGNSPGTVKGSPQATHISPMCYAGMKLGVATPKPWQVVKASPVGPKNVDRSYQIEGFDSHFHLDRKAGALGRIP